MSTGSGGSRRPRLGTTGEARGLCGRPPVARGLRRRTSCGPPARSSGWPDRGSHRIYGAACSRGLATAWVGSAVGGDSHEVSPPVCQACAAGARGTEAAGPLCGGGRSVACRTVTVPQHPNGAGDPGLSQPVGKRAMARDKVKRNVVELTEVPTGQPGRRSKSLSSQQADDVLTKAAPDRLHAYIVVSLLTGARTEELRAGLGACPPRPGLRTAVPRSMAIGASSRRYQDPKVASHPSLGQSLCRRASRPASAAGEGPAGCGGAVDRDRARVHHPARHWHGRG
jgi:hypothetical protein